MIRWDDWSDPGRIYDMWQRNFRDPAPYADFYFSEVYGKNELVLRLDEESEDLMGMIHLNPYLLSMRGKKMPAHYIVGVATDEDYRRQGVMRSLLAESFSVLKARGECLTYLMPADEAYYLPFDFRFGRPWLEMECSMQGEPEDPGLIFLNRSSDRGQTRKEDPAEEENRDKAGRYDLFTRVSADYLDRLDKEAVADFGHMYLVYEGESYLGRFCAAMEYDCLILSRIYCLGDEDCRRDFLKKILAYSRRKFHYGHYQLILDHTWKSALPGTGDLQGLRCMPAKEKDKIMFRILDLEELALYLKAAGEGSLRIEIRDPFIPDNQGVYDIRWHHGQVTFQKRTADEKGVSEGKEGSYGGLPFIGISDLTAWLFGGMNQEELIGLEGLGEEAAKKLAMIEPVSSCCIMEIV